MHLTDLVPDAKIPSISAVPGDLTHRERANSKTETRLPLLSSFAEQNSQVEALCISLRFLMITFRCNGVVEKKYCTLRFSPKFKTR